MSNYAGRIQDFWSDVSNMESTVKTEAGKQTLQLRNNAVYITSLAVNRGSSNSAVAGKISEATIRDAAKFIVEGTHRLSMDDEIAEYLRDMKTKRSIASATSAASLKTIGLGVKP